MSTASKLLTASLLLLLVSPGEAGLLRKVISVTGGLGADYREAVMSLGPTAYWRLGESSGTTAEDELDTYDGTYTNGPTLGTASLVPNSNNTAITCVAANDEYVSAPDTPLNTTYSMVAWVNTSSKGAFQGVVSLLDIVGSLNGYILQIQITSGYLAGVSCQGSGAPACSTWASTTDVADGSDHMIAMTFNNGTASLYVDGSVVTSFAGQFIPVGGQDPLNIFLGRRNDGFPLDGVLDEVAVWENVDLGPSGITTLWNAAQ